VRSWQSVSAGHAASLGKDRRSLYSGIECCQSVDHPGPWVTRISRTAVGSVRRLHDRT
jgi:hypothetical protein